MDKNTGRLLHIQDVSETEILQPSRKRKNDEDPEIEPEYIGISKILGMSKKRYSIKF